MAERTTKGSEFQALDPEFLAKTRAELAQTRLALEKVRAQNRAARDELEPMLDEIVGEVSELDEKEGELEIALEKVRADRNELWSAHGEIEGKVSELDEKEGNLQKHIDALLVLLGELPFVEPEPAGPKPISKQAGDGKFTIPTAYDLAWLGHWSSRTLQQDSADLVVNLLKSVGKPLHYRDIYEELKTNEFFRAAGHGSLGDVDPAATLLSRFFKDPRLYRPRRGTYALVEWLDHEDDQSTDERTGAADRLAATRRLIRGGKSQFRWDHDVLGAAERALRDAGSPMHHLALTEKMIELGPWKPLESTPKNVVSLRLAKDIREHGDRSRFRRFGRGIYGLSEWGDGE